MSNFICADINANKRFNYIEDITWPKEGAKFLFKC